MTGQQLGVTAAFYHAAFFHDINSVGVYHIHEPVGHQQHCFGLGQFLNLLHKDGFAFYVDIGGSFIENVYRAVV